MTSINGKYIVESVEAKRSKVVVKSKMDTTDPNDQNSDWVKEHIALYGKALELF